MNKNVEGLRTILKEYSPFEPAYKGLIDIEVLKGVLDEVDRLNNIINELEEYIKQYLYMLNGIQDRDVYEEQQLDDFTMIMEKLQELKGSDK